MQKRFFRQVKEALKPLLKFKQWIEAIYVYGSSVKKSRGKGGKGRDNKGNDIDVLIIINDSSVPPGPAIISAIEEECRKIEEEEKEKNLNFHFQPMKTLSKWWYLLLSGEPWIVTSLKNTLIIFDKKNLIKEAAKLVKEESLYRKEERAEKLLARSINYALKNRQLLLNSLKNLADAATEAAQILLLFDNKIILSKKKIAEELEQYITKLGEDMIGTYKEIIDLEEKMEKGFLSEFSAENLEYYLQKVKRFITKIETLLSK